MAVYIMLSNVTDEGAKTLKEHADRIRQVNQEIEKYGAHVKDQYATLGPYDFVNIIEAPDNATIARVSAELASRGTLRIMTLAAMPIDEFISRFQQTK